MIENKIVKLGVANEFDKGWALFRPFIPSIDAGKNRGGFSPSAVISKITKAEKINIVLGEICLSSAICRELEWVSKYISINLVAQNEQIAAFYSSKFKIEDVRIDSALSLNYLAILSKEPLYILIGETYIEVDSTINDVYFESKRGIGIHLSEIRAVYAIDFTVASDTLDFLKSFKGAAKYYIIPKTAFSKDVYHVFKNSANDLLIGEVFRTGIVVEDNNKELFLLHKLPNGVLFKEKISGIGDFANRFFKCELLSENIDYAKISKDFYIWDNGTLTPISIEPRVTVKKSVQMSDMHSFAVEEFDRSIMDSHNDYSGQAERVEYVFELIPPILPRNAQYSVLYADLLNCLNEWKTLRSSVFKASAGELLRITNVSQLYSMCFNFQVWNQWLENAISKYDFRQFSTKLAEFKAFIEKSKENLLSYMGEIYSSLGISSDSGRFDKIDAEIAGYEQIIAEKQALIEQKIDVLGSKRRIEILQKKINDLLALKSHFENDAGNRTDKATTAFLSRCREYLKGVQKKENDGSLVNIVKVKEESKEALLEAFASERLYDLNEQLEKHLSVITKMFPIEIPDDYTVYDADGKRMIVIGEIEEFVGTQEIRKKFNLNCVVRR